MCTIDACVVARRWVFGVLCDALALCQSPLGGVLINDSTRMLSLRRTGPVSLPYWRKCLIYWHPILRARIFGPPACGDAGCHTARTGKAASDSKHLSQYGSETGSVLRDLDFAVRLEEGWQLDAPES